MSGIGWGQGGAAVGIGAVAGLVGGLAGVGGSLIMLPALALVLGFDDPARSAQHVYQAAAMIVNVLVAVPATYRHAKAGALRPRLLKVLIPSMTVAMVAGVLLSNRMDGRSLQQALAIFIGWDALVNVWRLVRSTDESKLGPERTGPGVLSIAGLISGLAGGLAGLGGGGLMVPILQVAAKMKLKEAIATSAAVMCVSSVVGAGLKITTIGQHGRTVGEALTLVALMAPGAIVGSLIGATLTHKLPVKSLRIVVSAVMLALAAKLAVG